MMRAATFFTGRSSPTPRVAGLRISSGILVVLSLLTAACTEPPPPPPEVMMESDDPVAPFVGTWDLVDWRIVEPSGEVVFPWGEDPRGQLVYTREGRMSAHLMASPPDPADGSGGRRDLSYWGSFSVDPDAETVTHHVTGSSAPGWPGSDQIRSFQFLGADRLLLSAPRGPSSGATAPHRLTWVRVRATDR